MPLLKNCCFCVSLHNGGLILGTLVLVASVIATLAAGVLLFGGLNSVFEVDPNKLWICGFLLGFCILIVIAASMLIFGVVKVMS